MTRDIQEGITPIFLWMDTEFTGADPDEGHKLLEVASIVTDLGLREIDSFESFVRQDWDEVFELMQKNPFWDDKPTLADHMAAHVPNGLPVAEVEQGVLSLVAKHFVETKPILTGNSIHHDWLHVRTAMPRLAATLSHRFLDISTLAIFNSTYLGNLPYNAKLYPHQAMRDIRESLDEARFIITNAGIDLSLL